jgi:hypothetical protein
MRLRRSLLASSFVVCTVGAAHAQEPPPRIGPYVVDVSAVFPRFSDDPALALSRGLATTDLPGAGLGLDLAGHVYVLKWKAVTLGLGGQLLLAHARKESAAGVEVAGGGVTERLTSFMTQLSLNFGTGDGWSYISGGFGPSTWSIVADGSSSLPADHERISTVNYGGGARWFIKKHIAFHFDVRVHILSPGAPTETMPGSPRTAMFMVGAGVSLK